MSGPVTVPLSKPITAHGEELRELVLREPTADDVMQEGYPYIVVPAQGGGQGIQLQPSVVGRYAMRLAGIPMPSVKQLSVDDIQRLQVAVMGFFGMADQGQDGSST